MSNTQHSGADGLMGNGRRLLDQTYEQIHNDPLAVAHTMANLITGLHKVRNELPPEAWHTFCKEVAPKHKLTELMHQDPFTSHSACKPRGYAGDAELLDYLYGHRPAPTDKLARGIFDYTTTTPSSRAVPTRAQLIAKIVDRLAEDRRSVRVLSIACGHLREAEMSAAFHNGTVAEYVAFDQDPRSLAHIRERLAGKNVRTVEGSVAELMMGKHKDLGQFDLVYASGLYDYLSQKLATRMTTWMFSATRPLGITLLTNYLQDIIVDGYMEAFMQWDLIFRTPEELIDTARRIPADQIAETKTYIEEGSAVVFVELHKASRVRTAADIPSHPISQGQVEARSTDHAMGT